ncbi:CopG family transcriptional regulator [Pseudactinotalea sp. Z1748]
MDERRDQSVTLRLTADELDQIDHRAAEEGRDRSGMIRWAIQRYLERER